MTRTPPDVKSIFGRALEIESPVARVAYLDEACGKDAGLRTEVEGLLATLDRVGEFMRQPAAAIAMGQTANYEPINEKPGMAIGPYKLMEQIGEGGMGLVFVAEQQHPVRRKVALKIIKPGMDSAQVVARFEAERQALALMDHQNIAKVYDAGTTQSGQPYFVMELVHGIPITDYCDANKLTPRQRLELFIHVCHAIQHAHQKGIIHRDIKPSNILVTMYDDKPVPKVIDFGVAKAVEQRLTEKTIYTQFGTLVGTFEYMSPEQAEMNAFGVDTRSDIYALGVVLYELLTGSTPLERQRLREAAFGEIVRLIKEEEPQRPSVRISSSGTLAKVAAARKTDSGRLSRLVCGELDWVVMRCLEKDRTRRYETASGLAKDIERYLKDEPVEACPPSLAYRLQKLFSKNRTALTTTAAIMLLLIAGVVVSSWQAFRAAHAEEQAIAESVNAFAAAEKERDARAREVEQRSIAETERDAKGIALKEKEAVLRRSQGMQLTLRSELARPTNPGSALVLAFEGARRHSGLLANNALIASLDVNLELRTLLGHAGKVNSCAFSPDGLRIITGGEDRMARIWDAVTGQEIMLLDDHDQQVVHAAFSPDGQRILTITSLRNNSGDGFGIEGVGIAPVTARLWEAATGRLIASWQDPSEDKSRRDRFRIPTLSAAFSPDSSRIVTTFAVWPDGEPQVRNGITGQLLHRLDGHRGPVVAVAFSPDGKQIATASADASAILWDADFGKQVHKLKHPLGIGFVAFSPDSKRLLTICNGVKLSKSKLTDADRIDGHESFIREETVGRIWDCATGKELTALKFPDGGKSYGNSGAFTLDGRRVVITAADYIDQFGGELSWVWDAESGKLLARELGRNPESPIKAQVKFSNDHRWLLTFTDRDVQLRNGSSGKTQAIFKGHSDTILQAAFSPDGRRVVTAGADGTARIWDSDLGSESAARRGRWSGADDVIFSPDGKFLLELPNLLIWNLSTQRVMATLKDQGDSIARSATYSEDGTKILTVSDDHIVRIWNARTGALSASLSGHSELVYKAIFSPEGSRVVTASHDGTARIWNATSGKEMARLQQTENNKTAGTNGKNPLFIGIVEFSPDGRRIVGTPAASATWIAGSWNAENGKEMQVLPQPGNLLGNNTVALLSPNGRHLVTADPSGVWNLETGKFELALRTPDFIPQQFRASLDGKLIAASNEDYRNIFVLDTSNGKVVATLKGHMAGVVSTSFNRDGTRLVTASKDETARVWDIATGLELLMLPHPRIKSVSFTPDGSHVKTASSGSVRLWPVDPLSAAEVRIPRKLTQAERKLFELDE